VNRLGPLRHRAYRLVWLGRATSSIGDQLIFVAFAFAVLHVGGSASDLGLILGGGTLVRVVLLLVGGVWADRLPRQLVMLATDGLRGGVELAVALLLITGHATLWQLTAGYLLHSAGASFFGPASDGLVPQLVPKEELQRANALLELTQNVPAIFGPVVAGVLVAAFGTGWVFLLDAVTFAGSALCLSLVRLPPKEPREREPFLRELAEGWNAVRSRDWYWQNLITHALWNFAFPFVVVLGPLVALRHLGGAGAWGLIAGAGGLGYVLGSLLVLRWRPRRPLVAGNLGLVLGAAPLLLLAIPADKWAIAGGQLAAALGLGVLNTLWWSVVQARVPQEVISRVSSWDWLISLVINPAGLALAGPLAVAFGIRPALLVAAALIAIPSAVICVVPAVRRIEREPDEPAPALAT
jgi:MFS family permease